MVHNHVIEEVNYHDEIGIRGFGFNLFDEDEERVGREVLSEYPYLLISMKVWPGYWKNQLERMNMKVDEENGKAAGMVNGRYRKVRRFSINGFLMNIGCLVSAPTFGIGGGQGFGRRKSHKRSFKIRGRGIKLGLRLICMALYILYYLLSSILFYDYTNTSRQICSISLIR